MARADGDEADGARRISTGRTSVRPSSCHPLVCIQSTTLRRAFGLLFAGMLAFLSGCVSEPEPEPVPALLDTKTQALLISGEDALNAQLFRRALAYADSAAARVPGGADVHFLRGRIYTEMARLGAADSAYKQALALQPGYEGAWNNLGNNAAHRHEYREAIALYHKELERGPAPLPWRGIGQAYVELGRVDSARQAFEQALAIDSTYAGAHHDLTLLYEDEGNFEQALYHAEQALAMAPENHNVRYLVGSLLVKMRQMEAALPYLETVAEAWPWHHASHYNLGQALARLGREDEAKAYLDRAETLRALQSKIMQREVSVRSFPEDPYAHAALASALRQAGRYDDAMHSYKVALFLKPSDTEFQNNVAILHLLRGDNDEAIQWFENILRQDSTLADVWMNLGIVYAKSDRKAEARRAWEMALRQKPGRPQEEAARAYIARLDSTTAG